ncbi:MAG: TlpA disulfide reductase family protein [Rhodobacteraceae bacterium]|nr:TlpA disulfide reductase family protein [Paracoccaceae bacterium]
MKELKPIKINLWILIYVFFIGLANPIIASDYDFVTLNALKEGELKSLIIHKDPQKIKPDSFLDPSQNEVHLDQFNGQVLVVNFWATWCAPCRKELPTLDRLQSHFNPEQVKIIVVHVGRTSAEVVSQFWQENQIQHIESYYDPKLKFSRSMSAIGLPTTVLITKEGEEFARLLGDIEWDQENVIQILENVLDTNS